MPAVPLTLLSPDVVIDIKSQIRRVWERVSHTRANYTQSSLANALGISQGAVSKLLHDDKGHPWTKSKVESFAHFCRVDISEIVQDERLRGFFSGWTSPSTEPNPDLVEECRSALLQYFAERGRTLSRPKAEQLASKIAVRVTHTDKSLADIKKAIKDVILDEAGKD